ncbi:hypothetical protein ACOALZ_17170 [Nocardiopsis algeriensis]|uniref:hypothetical protein n=1 Tax=Nocardiopsis algeriensis TaxID=1478215 RepID=UPI003B42CD00
MGDTDPAGALRRWEDHGGTWRVVGRSEGQVAVSLRRCDGGEEVERLVSGDAALLDHIGTRTEGP